MYKAASTTKLNRDQITQQQHLAAHCSPRGRIGAPQSAARSKHVEETLEELILRPLSSLDSAAIRKYCFTTRASYRPQPMLQGQEVCRSSTLADGRAFSSPNGNIPPQQTVEASLGRTFSPPPTHHRKPVDHLRNAFFQI